MTKLEEVVVELLDRAKKAVGSADALRLSQAALNAANTKRALGNLKD